MKPQARARAHTCIYVNKKLLSSFQSSANNHNYVYENLDRITRHGGIIARFIIYALSHIAEGCTIIEIHYSSGE